MSHSLPIRSFSVGSEGSDYDHEHHVDHKTRKKLEKKFEWKRKKVYFIVAALFLVPMTFLILSVVHDQTWIKVDCEGTIDECTKQYCPNMFRWSHNDDSCHPIKGYECCDPGNYVCSDSKHVWCYFPSNVTLSDDGKVCCNIPKIDLNVNGIAPYAYKNTCRDGQIWVEWRRICIPQ